LQTWHADSFNGANMGDIGQHTSAVNTFSIHGKSTRVSLSASGIFIDLPNGVWRNKKPAVIPFNKIVSTECSHSHKTNIARPTLFKSLKLSKFSFSLFKRGYRSLDHAYEACEESIDKEVSDSITIHYAEELKEKGLIKLKKVTLHHDDSDVINGWSSVIQSKVSALTSRPKKLLVFINPFGGKGKAKKLWENKLSTIFNLAGISTEVIVTEKAKYALFLLQTIPLQNYDGVVSVGGDGMFAEVFNGLLIRAARDAKQDIDDKTTKFVKPGVRVGFIPAGSTDSISMCLHGSTEPVTATLHIVLGDRMMVDVVSIHSQEKLERFAMTMVSYGYFGDLMTHSEEFRWLGRSRYSMSGIRTFLAHRSYKGIIRYSAEDEHQKGLLVGRCGEGCPTCSCEQENGEKKKEGETVSMNNIHNTENNDEDKNYWKKKEIEVRGSYLAVSSATLSCSCRHTVPGLSPSAHTGDGTTDIIIVHKTHHLNYLRYLYRTAFNQSHPFNLPFVQAVRVKSWSFQPEDTGNNSTWNCDGEVVGTPEIFVRSHKKLVPVFARGVYSKQFEMERKMSDEAELFDAIPEVL